MPAIGRGLDVPSSAGHLSEVAQTPFAVRWGWGMRRLPWSGAGEPVGYEAVEADVLFGGFAGKAAVDL